MMIEPSNINFSERARFRLNKVALGFALGLTLGVMLMLVTWWVLVFSGESAFLAGIGTFFFGYSVSIAGSVMGFLWGLVAGFAFGFSIGLVYNESNRYLEHKAATKSKAWADKIDAAINPETEPEKKKAEA
jgi:hypothetical protein